METNAAALRLAIELHNRGHIDEAEHAYRGILAAEPNHAGALNLLGVIRHQQGRHEEALELIGRAIAINPGQAIFHNNYGAARLSLQRYHEAEASFRRALAIRPNYADALANLGMALTAFEEAQKDPSPAPLPAGRSPNPLPVGAGSEACYRRALQCQPWHRDATTRLVGLLDGQGRGDEARSLLASAIASAPCAQFHTALGNLLVASGRAGDAIRHYRAAIEMKPDHAVAHFNLAQALDELHDTDEAGRHFVRAAELRPDKPLWRLRAEVCGPVVFGSNDEIEEYCKRLKRTLNDGYIRMPPPALPVSEGRGEAMEAGAFAGFGLSYLGRNVRQLKERFAARFDPLFRDVAQANLPSDSQIGNLSDGSRTRIGFVVTRRHEGIFARCLGGVLRHLDPERFEPVVLASRASIDLLKQRLANDRLRYVAFRDSQAEAIREIRAAACDIIYYWEVGSDSLNYFLPFARLGAVQCTSHGSLVTTGVPAIDWFFSSSLMEDGAAAEHYSERLWQSRTLLMCQERLRPVSPAWPGYFGLPDNRRLYGCFQNPLKLHPDFDDLLAGILAADPQGTIVLLADGAGHAAAALRARFARHMPGLADRITFLPRQNFVDYCRLLQVFDVVLDPLHYGAGSSCYDVFSFDLPMVTLPTALMPGRVALGF